MSRSTFVLIVLTLACADPTLRKSEAIGQARDVVAAARHAVESDSADVYARRWRARHRANDRMAELGLATLARLTYDYADADRRYDALVSSVDPPDEIAAYALLGRGQSEAQRWRRQDAMPDLERAASAARATGDSLAEAEALVGLAQFIGRGGNADSALTLIQRAYALATADPTLHAMIGCAIAAAQARRSIARADSMMNAAVTRAAQTGAARATAGCRLGRAQLHELVGEQRSAIFAADSALADATRARDYATMATAAQFRAYLTTQYDQRFDLGRRYALDAIAYGERSGNALAVGWAELNLMQVAIRVGDARMAVRHADRARYVLEPLSDIQGLAALRIVEGDAESLMARVDRARASYRMADSMYARMRFEAARPNVLYKRAALESAAGNLDEASNALEAGHAIATRLGQTGLAQTDFHYLHGLIALRANDAKTATASFETFLSNFNPRHQHYLFDGRIRLAESQARAGRLDDTERTIGLAFLDLDHVRGILGDRDARIAVLQSRRFEFDPDLGIATIVNLLAADGRIETAFRLTEAQRARHLWEQVVRRGALAGAVDSTDVRSTRLVADAVDAATLRAQLPDSTAILEFITGSGGEPTTLFIVQRDGTSALTLPSGDSLVTEIVRFAGALEGGVHAATLSRKLAERVFDPAIALLHADVSRLIIVPDGPLHRLPFDALQLADGRFAIERFTITLAPSSRLAHAYWSRQASSATRPTGRLVAFADPRFATQTGLSRLAGSEREARAIARHAESPTVFIGRRATEDALNGIDWSDVSVLHLATHARVEDYSVLSSAFFLGPGTSDGRVEPMDIAVLPLAADLVVLSACRTIGGAVVSGEGLQGLTTPFLEAGARAVVATYWSVGDRSLVSLMDQFYAALARGLTTADALHSARLESLRAGDPPNVWAALAFTGDAGSRPHLSWR